MKKLLLLSFVLIMVLSALPCSADNATLAQGDASAHIYTFEELTGLSREDIDHISICSGKNGIYYSTTYDKVIDDIYNAINTKSFSVDINDDVSDSFDYRVLFFDSKDMPYNMAYTYVIPHGIVIKEKDGLTYRTSNENELKQVVEKSYNLIADVETEKTSTFEELTGLSDENIERVSVACSKDGRTEFSTMSPYVISNILYDFKDVKFTEDTRDGSAGGWLYFINFYLRDGTYVQLGTRINVNKTDYIAVDYNKIIDKMAYYHELMKNIDCSEWASDYILECIERGFLDDVTNISYKDSITREKFCEILFNIYSKSIDNPKTWNINMKMMFDDCQNEKVAILFLEGIINGKGDKIFAPNDYLTREEAATILVRYINKFMPGISVTQKYFNYEDINKVSDWSFDSVQAISNVGVMQGIGDNEFAPQDTYTAEQAITTLIRLYNKN